MVLLIGLVVGVAGGLAPDPATAQPGGDAGYVQVIEVPGLLDPVLVDFVEQSIEQATADGAVALVLQLDSGGAVVSDDRFVALGRRIAAAEIPVAVWVGPSGAVAYGAAAELVAIADESAMAPGTRLGRMGEQRLPEDEFGVLFGDEHNRLEDGTVGSEQAFELGITTDFATVASDPADEADADPDATAPAPDDTEAAEDAPEVLPGAPTVGDLVVNLDGVEVEEVTEDGQVRRRPVTAVVFSSLPLWSQLAHTVASPNVAYLLVVVGLGLLLFELYTAGIGIAGGVGAGCLILGCYGLWVLPTNWWAFALLLFAFFGFAVDVQTGVPRVWTWIGLVVFSAASFVLYDGLSLSWITLLVGIIGALLAFLVGMPAMVRTRFATPTIGREWMIGELGVAVADVDPDGTVLIQDALWRASTNRATPVAKGDPVRVVAIDGLTLEVEPEEGGAKDYRDLRGSRS